MFTGLVQAVGRVDRIEPSPAGARLLIDTQGWSHRPQTGDSISVSGCCLTVAAVEHAGAAVYLAFDAVPETLARTVLGRLEAGSRVNIEHAVTAETLMGGHFVQGHVDGVGLVAAVQRPADSDASPHDQKEWRVRVSPPHALMEYVAPKGSITIDGVSLTVAALDPADAWFEVALIPVTLDKTTLGERREGDAVNLEMDILAKQVVHWIKHYGQAGQA